MTRILVILILGFGLTSYGGELIWNNSDANYLTLLTQVMCQVKCLNQSRELQRPILDDDNLLFTKSMTCLSSSCQNCLQVKPCGVKNQSNCCEEPDLSGSSVWISDPEMTLRPIFHCSTFIHENASFEVYFRLEYSQLASNLTNETEFEIPLLFLIVTETKDKSMEWTIYDQFVTSSWFPSVNVQANVTFRLQVTPVGLNGPYAPVYSDSMLINPSRDRGVRHPPKNVTVRRIRQNPLVTSHPDLQVLLHWESGMGHEATCAGRIWYLNDDAMNRDYLSANQSFWFNWTNETAGYCLSFDTNYSILIAEVSDIYKEHYSNETQVTFKLPPCLEFFHNNFTMCPPSPPRDLTFTVNSNSDMVVSWLPPLHTSLTNQIDSYDIRVIKYNPHYQSKSLSMPGTATHTTTLLANISVAGNKNSIIFRNVTHSGLVQVMIRAVTRGGNSLMRIEGPHPTAAHFEESVIDKFLVAGLVLLILMIFMVVALVLKIRKAKQERRRVRAKYFGDDKDFAQEPECSYFPSYCSKWLIETNCLKMGEIIGEGNFGQVHAATLYKSQSSRIVAVKTLKEGVDFGEKSKFWEEFQILKNLEPHPNLVRLIGIVKANYPTLVVEYCDGGDLHSYLRKLRDDKLKRLTREKRRLKWMSSGTISGEFLRHSTAVPNLSDFDRYTTTTKNTAVPVENLNLSGVTNEAYFYSRNKSPDPGISGVMDPAEFNLFASFARQIAVGMEFLSTNKIVHRDLAARNILVMNESKPVLKIADFGLSRDVYEKNWYKKNSDDKIPFKWMALECLLDEVYTTKSDVWSYGVLLWEIVTYGGSPYPGIKNVEIFEFLKKGFRMSQPDGCPAELYLLMRKCWEKDSEDRPDFATLRRLLDTMIEKSESLDYFQLLDIRGSGSPGPWLESSQSSTLETVEADVKYSTLTSFDDREGDSDTSKNVSSQQHLIPSKENILYASIMDACSEGSTERVTDDIRLPDPDEFLDSTTTRSLCNGLGNGIGFETKFDMSTKLRQHSYEFPKELLISSSSISASSEKQFLRQNNRSQSTVRYSSLAGIKSGAPVVFV